MHSLVPEGDTFCLISLDPALPVKFASDDCVVLTISEHLDARGDCPPRSLTGLWFSLFLFVWGLSPLLYQALVASQASASHSVDIDPNVQHVYVVNFGRDVAKSPLLGLPPALGMPLIFSAPPLILVVRACE